MKNLLFTLSMFLMANLVVNGQEIIKTKPIEQINVKSPTLRHPEANSEISNRDSSITIRICSPSRAEMLSRPQPLYVLKIGKNQYKIDGKEMITNHKLSKMSPMNIQNISIAKDTESISTFGDEGKNGVIFITFKDNKESDDFSKSLKSFRIKKIGKKVIKSYNPLLFISFAIKLNSLPICPAIAVFSSALLNK